MMKLVIADLDGTLFDTKDVNYHAYKDALGLYGYTLDYEYYCRFCNGKHYMDFLPDITTDDKEILSAMHKAKKQLYRQYLNKAVPNYRLIDMLRLMRGEYKVALVTTASKENCYEILKRYDLVALFDLILTHDDVEQVKPNPEGFLKAMKYFNVFPENTIIFEDSGVGLEAAEKSGAFYYQTYKYN